MFNYHQLECLRAHSLAMAMRLGMRRVDTAAALAEVALLPRWIQAVLI
jgi:hypothetical protein